MLSIAQEYILMESMDSPWDLTPIGLTINHHGQDMTLGMDDKDLNIHGRRLFSTGGHGYISDFERKGAIEVHHYDQDTLESTGILRKGPPNPKFVSTMFNLAKQHLANGKSVRVIGDAESGGVATYHRLALLLAKKHGHTVGLISPNSDEKSEFTIHPKKMIDNGINEMIARVNESAFTRYFPD